MPLILAVKKTNSRKNMAALRCNFATISHNTAPIAKTENPSKKILFATKKAPNTLKNVPNHETSFNQLIPDFLNLTIFEYLPIVIILFT